MGIVTRSERILVEGDHNVVKMFPLFGKGEPLYMWAERGLICWEYAKTNGYGTMYWRDAAERVLGLSEMLSRRDPNDDALYRDERERLQRFVCSMEDVIRKAKEQGSPDDDVAARDLARRRAKTVMVPRKIDAVDPFPSL